MGHHDLRVLKTFQVVLGSHFPLAGVNAQFIPGDWDRGSPRGHAPFLEGDFANDGQDDYLDYMEQEQLGDTAPNLNIRVVICILLI